MNLSITFKQLDQTLEIENLIRRKILKLKKYFSQSVDISWNCYMDSGEHKSEVIISGFSGPQISAKAVSNQPTKTLDQVIEKLEQQLRRRRKHLRTKQVDKSKMTYEMETSFDSK